MRSTKKKSLAPRASGKAKAKPDAGPKGGFFGLGGDKAVRAKAEDITFIFRNLATLIENGVSLPKALGALADEKSLERCRQLLLGLRRELESGATFSAALAKFDSTFDVITVNQVRVGERAGTLGSTLDNIATQREKAGKLKETIVKKLAYPAMLTVMGSGVITFLLMYVVPVFEETYRSARVPLPGITQTLITVGAIAQSYGLFIGGAIVLAVVGVQQARKRPHIAHEMDARLLQLPLLGEWLRDIAVLELMEVLGNLMEAGFTLAEALKEAGDSVGNRVVKQSAHDLNAAVNRGERFSREIERMGDLFPPIVSQLVIVGEQTGNLAKATEHIRSHLQIEVERRANVFVGVIEPTLTMGMAIAVAVILLAIYLPMFDMINTVGA
ncbi:MAG: type II secretion system F family protein [Planctomycetota bacterium]